jgi:hypothetical protein
MMERLSWLLFAPLLLAGWSVGDAQAQRSFRCKGPKGEIIFQQTPCKDETPPPPPPPPRKPLTCHLNNDQIVRATRLENQFVDRFPTEAEHLQAQEGAAGPVAERIRDAEARLKALEEQRKPLDKEREFYPGKPLPSALKSKIDANDAQTTAMTDILRSRKQELADIQARFKCERDTFGVMWKNAASGESACSPPACAPR